MNMVKTQVQRLIEIVNELEAEFPGRHFTLDGHLIGSIGEVMAAYYYGIELYTASTEIHDGEVEGRKLSWESASKKDSHNNRHMRVNKLMELDCEVSNQQRILAKQKIVKMEPEYKNKK